MLELTIDSFLLIRAPAYSYENFNQDFLKRVLKTDFFRAALFIGSQTLFTELKKKDFDYDLLSPSAVITLWKYLNRMCYRALPYGLFSCYAKGVWSERENDALCFHLADEIIIHPDFKIVTEQVSMLDLGRFPSLKYYTNNSIYRSARQLRFMSQAYSAKHKYAIVELKIVPGLIQLLKFIEKGQTKAAIISFLKAEYGENVPAEAYFESLLEGQVIVSALAPNVTGKTYHQRCIDLLTDYAEPGIQELSTLSILMDNPWQELKELNLYIGNLLLKKTENPTYTLYERHVNGGLKKKLRTELIALVSYMDKLSADQQLNVMGRFKSEFIQKYDQQEVSLMIALDPGSGIGYENLASVFDEQNDDFIDDLRKREERQKNTKWGAVEKMIFKKWNSLSNNMQDKIIITPEDLHNLPDSMHVLPPGLSALFKVVDDQIWLDQMGGISGIEICARFAGSGSAMEASLSNICAQEMQVNAGFVFAEIAFSPNDRASNINQRGNFYPYEIPLLTHSSLPEERIIKLSDLVISVRDGQILLRSLRLNKYVIPRLSSAYNYQLMAIPVLRFLGDLQFQGIKADLSFSLVELFPGMEYYPRVEIGNAVISPATWILTEEQLKKINEGWTWQEELRLTDHFSLHEGDNFLVFDRNNPDDMLMFVKCIKNKKTATVTEYVLPVESELKNEAGAPFAAQMVACIINQKGSYQAPTHQVTRYTRNYTKVKRSFLPGEEWLYIKLYTHYSLTDEILLNFILPVIKKHKRGNPGFKWFFIRYQDPGHHLRLRFFTSAGSSYELLSDLIHKLQGWSREGKVSDVILDSYQRELEKYSAILINEVESFFYRDSEFILSVFRDNVLNSAFKLSFAVNTTLQIIHCFITDKKERIDFITSVFESSSEEFSGDKEVVRKLDVKYRKFQQQLISARPFPDNPMNDNFFIDYQLIMKEIALRTEDWERAERYHLLINLVHMHINRIFENTPREYEYLAYHFMKKHQSYLNYTAIAES